MSEHISNIRALPVARILLLLGVVLIHSNFSPGDISVSPHASRVMDFFAVDLAGACVPAFFIISGFLFFRNIPRHDGADSVLPPPFPFFRDKFMSRVRTLLIPYLLWNTVGAALFLVKVLVLGMPGFGVVHDGIFSFPAFLVGFLSLDGGMPYDMPLWFLRNLIFFVIASPALGVIARDRVLASVALLLFITTGMQASGAIWFIVGARVGMLYPAPELPRSPVALASFCAVFVGCALLSGLIGYDNDMYQQILYNVIILVRNISGCVTAVAIGNLFSGPAIMRRMSLLSAAAFFVYAFHGLYCSVARRFVFSLLGYPSAAALQICAFFVTFLLLTLTSFVAFLMMRRLSPRLASLLTGAR